VVPNSLVARERRAKAAVGIQIVEALLQCVQSCGSDSWECLSGGFRYQACIALKAERREEQPNQTDGCEKKVKR